MTTTRCWVHERDHLHRLRVLCSQRVDAIVGEHALHLAFVVSSVLNLLEQFLCTLHRPAAGIQIREATRTGDSYPVVHEQLQVIQRRTVQCQLIDGRIVVHRHSKRSRKWGGRDHVWP